MQEFIKKSKDIVLGYLNMTDKSPDEVYVVWMCKTLQNNKALLATTRDDGLYFECTYNGDKHELYFDAYSKICNMAISYDD